jgi:hypothetical protein
MHQLTRPNLSPSTVWKDLAPRVSVGQTARGATPDPFREALHRSLRSKGTLLEAEGSIKFIGA